MVITHENKFWFETKQFYTQSPDSISLESSVQTETQRKNNKDRHICTNNHVRGTEVSYYYRFLTTIFSNVDSNKNIALRVSNCYITCICLLTVLEGRRTIGLETFNITRFYL